MLAQRALQQSTNPGQSRCRWRAIRRSRSAYARSRHSPYMPHRHFASDCSPKLAAVKMVDGARLRHRPC